jgi:hypothetical protein
MTRLKVVTQLSFESGMERAAVIRSNVHRAPVTNLQVMTNLNFVIKRSRGICGFTLHIPITNVQVMTAFNFVIPSAAEFPAGRKFGKARDLQFF